jgi:hypothetical protein
MIDDQARNIPIDAIQKALPDADWTQFNARTAAGYEFLRTTVIGGKVYWWMRRKGRLALIASPLNGQDTELLKTLMEEVPA